MNKKAFTLIELLVVVLIIGILAAIALPQYQVSVDKTRYTTMMATTRALRDAQKMYYLANGTYSSDMHDFEAILPAQCEVKSNASVACGLFGMALEETRVYSSLKVPHTSLIMGYNSDVIVCFPQQDGGKRAQRLCKTL